MVCSTAVSTAETGRALLASRDFVGLGHEQHRPLSTLLLPIGVSRLRYVWPVLIVILAPLWLRWTAR